MLNVNSFLGQLVVELALIIAQRAIFATFYWCQTICVEVQNPLESGVSQKLYLIACPLKILFEYFKIMSASHMARYR